MDADSSRCRRKFNTISNDDCVMRKIDCNDFFAMPCSHTLLICTSQIAESDL